MKPLRRTGAWPVAVLSALLLAPVLDVSPGLAQDGKIGYLAWQYVRMPLHQKDAYTTGVVDALDVMGVKCPYPAPSYVQIMADADTFIARNPEVRGLWAATAIMGAMAERGCGKQ